MHQIRAYEAADDEALAAFGAAVHPLWLRHECLCLTAGRPAIAMVQLIDRGSTPTRRPGRGEMRLSVAPACRRHGLGSALLDHAIAWAVPRALTSIRTSFQMLPPGQPEPPAARFLAGRGFVELQRYLGSRLDLTFWQLAPFLPALQRLEDEGIKFVRFDEVDRTPELIEALYELDDLGRRDIPLIETEPAEHESKSAWLTEFQQQTHPSLFLAMHRSSPVAMARIENWGFTTVRRDWRGKGLATALKAFGLNHARAAGMKEILTENAAANAPMLAVNRKLGYCFDPPEIEVIRRLGASRPS
jgi:GNAT superfamily N-acetyltransferase